MGALPYVGVLPGTATEISNQASIDATIGTTIPNKTTATSSVLDAVAKLCTLDAMRSKDNAFAIASEYKTKDTARNVPTTPVNVAGAPVQLVGGTVPATYFPALGNGFVNGGYGISYAGAGTATASPQLIGTINAGAVPSGIGYWPLCFGAVMVSCNDTGGRPVVEMRLGSGYGPLLAIGTGRTMFTGQQGISMVPASEGSGWFTGNGAGVTVSIWLYDANGRGVTVQGQGGADLIASTYLVLSSAPVVAK